MSGLVTAAVAEALEPWLGAGDRPPPTLVVALSGGLDSCVLLHALRFGLGRAHLRAAHFDHGMRPGSDADAAWVRGLCTAWDVELTTARWDQVDRREGGRPSEGAARTARYAFLHACRGRREPALLLTAHHADDQAETVLFRALRGTGVDGLTGIPAYRAPGLVRPLLPLWREELDAYARRHRVPWREDPTNRQAGYARNVLRHRILPLAEEAVPGARRALVRLSGIAGEEREAWRQALERIVDGLDPRTGESGDAGPAVSVDRDAFLALGPELGGRVLRHLVRDRLDLPAPDRAGTDRALAFAASGRSSGRVELGSGVVLARALQRLRIGVEAGEQARAPDDEGLCIPGPGRGEGDARIGGSRYRVCWAPAPAPASPTDVASTGGTSPGDDGPRPGAPASRRIHRWQGAASGEIVLRADAVRFPLRLRGRRPGDRLGVSGGGRKVKKVLLEARVPATARGRVPLLVDGEGRVVWIPGVAGVPGVGEVPGV
ncbi:MAG: tRNA lysidine(34) synthetase TilS, partial [Longimicrobiales bacterium]|nr:tRNA lysidine(34) synthetase TilS [Longimicrobiales bacterium]